MLADEGSVRKTLHEEEEGQAYVAIDIAMTFINGVLENTLIPTVDEVYRTPSVSIGLEPKRCMKGVPTCMVTVPSWITISIPAILYYRRDQ
jgi:hypothetical protein